MRLLLYTAVFLVMVTGIVWTTHYVYKQPLSARSSSDLNFTQFPVVNEIVVEEARFRSADETLDEAQLRQLPHYWATEPEPQSPPNNRVILVYTAEVHLDVPDFELWSIYIPEVLHDVEVVLNGNKIGRPLSPPLFSRLGLRTKFIPLPSGALKKGPNQFSLRITAKPARKAVLGKFYIGPASNLQPWHEAKLFQYRLQWSEAVALLLVGLVTIVFGRSSKSDPLYSWLGAMSLVWVTAMCSRLITQTSVDWKWVDFTESIAGIMFMCAACLFVLRFMDRAWQTLNNVILATGTLAIVASLANTAFDLPGDAPLQLCLAVLLILSAITGYHFIKHTITNTSEENLILSLTGCLVLCFGGYDIYINSSDETPLFSYLTTLTPVLLLVIGYVLVKRFYQALRALENQSILPAQQLQPLDSSAAVKQNILVAERERIMRDMHDGVGGHLVSSLSILRNNNISNPDLEETLSQALIDLRLMIDSLEETDGDLSVAVAMLKERTQRALKDSDTETKWLIEEVVLPSRGPGDTLQILRILQESIANVLKHANADQLAVSARMLQSDIAHFSVEDNGDGFDTATNKAGRGLLNLNRRAEAIGAKLEINSSETGTCVDLWVPDVDAQAQTETGEKS